MLRARGGGERMKLAANRPTRTLKNLLQEAGVPQWQRDRCCRCSNAMARCCGRLQLGIDCRFGAAADQPGILPVWLPG